MEPKVIGNFEEVDFESMRLIREVMAECPEVEALGRCNIKYLFATKQRKSRGQVTLGSCQVLPEKDGFLHDYKAVVIFDKTFWTEQPESRKPLIMHELCHLEVDDETGDLSSVEHDITEFFAVYKRYGDWMGQLANAENIQLELVLT